MKAMIININWCVSLFGLCIDTDHSPFWAVMIGVVYFLLSSTLLIYADKKGLSKRKK